jgi:hypothetical protein
LLILPVKIKLQRRVIAASARPPASPAENETDHVFQKLRSHTIYSWS